MDRRQVLTAAFLCALLAGVGAYIFGPISPVFTSACASATLDGHWKSSNFGDTSRMEADVYKNTIMVMWYADNASSLYWKGTFPKPPNVSDGVKVTSVGDVNLMRQYTMASHSDSKEFTYHNGKLEFTFTIMGVSRVIRLER